MAYIVLTGGIQAGAQYIVKGGQSVTYNAVVYATGQTFRGVSGVTSFTYSGTGTQEVNEVQEIGGGGLGFEVNGLDQPVYSSESTILNGMAICFELTDAEKIVQEVTVINGMALQLMDYPFYSYMITETRL